MLRALQNSTTAQIVVGVTLCIVVALIFQAVGAPPLSVDWIAVLGAPGELWMRALRGVVLPLIISSIILSMRQLGDIPHGGSKVGKHTLLFVLITGVLAIIESFVIIYVLVKPVGTSFALADIPASFTSEAAASRADVQNRTVTQQVLAIIIETIPKNIFNDLATENLLSVITMAIVVGLFVPDNSDRPSVIIRFAHEVDHIAKVVVSFLIKVAPIGITFILLPQLLKMRLSDVFAFVGIYVASVTLGIFIHVFAAMPFLYFAITRKNPIPLYRYFTPAALTALGTSSSAATIPVTLDCASKAGIARSISKFVVPLGATVCMNGTALGFPIAVTFQALALGTNLSVVDSIVVAALSFLGSIATAPIPSGGLIVLVMIQESVNISAGPVFGLIFAVDWLVDRPQTMANILGDLYTCAVVQHLNPHIADGVAITDDDAPYSDTDQATQRSLEDGVLNANEKTETEQTATNSPQA